MIERGAAARATGTTVEVRDLFFNTPARRKFLNSSRRASCAPRSACSRATRWRGPAPVSGSSWTNASASTGRSPARRRERAAQIWGARHAEQLLEARGERGGLELHALLGLPEHARATREGQVFLVNGRWVQSPALSQALRHAYGNLLPRGRFPVGGALAHGAARTGST